MSYQDLREYLEVLRQHGLLRVVERRINKDRELMPLVKWQYRGLEAEQRTGFWFKNITDSKGRSYNGSFAVGIVGANRAAYGLAMGCCAEEINSHWAEARNNPFQPRLVDTGPCKDEIHRGDGLLEHNGLEEFPIPVHTPGFDAAPFITAPLWHTKDPDTGVRNVGTHRAMLKGPLITGIDGPLASAHVFRHWHKWRKLGKPMEAALVIGGPPAVSLCSVTRVPYGVDELAVAGGMMGRPIDVVRCETIDMEVPAWAEIVIEGEVGIEYMEPEGPHGEYTGLIGERRPKPVFHVRCITHRKNPVYHAFISGMPPSESSLIRAVAEEANFLRFFQQECDLACVKQVVFQECSGAWQVCIIQIEREWTDETGQAEVWQALTGALARSTGWPKVVIAVDEDIDPRDMESVMWAISFRYQPHLDSKVINGRESRLDLSSAPPWVPSAERRFPKGATGPRGASAILIDATRKWPYLPVALARQDVALEAKAIWEELGLPTLHPRKPWHGYSLGYWDKENELEAELTLQGEYQQVAAKLAQQRIPLERQDKK